MSGSTYGEKKYTKKQFKKVVTEDLSNEVLKYLKKMNYSKNNYFAKLETKYKDGLETNIVSIYHSGLLPIPLLSQKICEVVGSRQFHDAGDIVKEHDDGSMEYKIFSEAKVQSKVFDETTISKITLERILLFNVDYMKTLEKADQGKIFANYMV